MEPYIAGMIRTNPSLGLEQIKVRVERIKRMRSSEHPMDRALVENQIVAMSREIIWAAAAEHPEAKAMAEEAMQVF